MCLGPQSVSGTILIFASALTSYSSTVHGDYLPAIRLGIMPASNFFLDCVYSLLLGKSIIQVLKPWDIISSNCWDWLLFSEYHNINIFLNILGFFGFDFVGWGRSKKPILYEILDSFNVHDANVTVLSFNLQKSLLSSPPPLHTSLLSSFFLLFYYIWLIWNLSDSDGVGSFQDAKGQFSQMAGRVHLIPCGSIQDTFYSKTMHC